MKKKEEKKGRTGCVRVHWKVMTASNQSHLKRVIFF